MVARRFAPYVRPALGAEHEWFMCKGMARMTGRAPAAGRSGIEPIEVTSIAVAPAERYQAPTRVGASDSVRFLSTCEVSRRLLFREARHPDHV